DALLERDVRPPPEVSGDLADVGPGDVRLPGAPWNVHHWAAQEFDEAIDGLRVAPSQVPDLACLLGLRGEQERLRDVGGVDEVSTLGPIADHRERLPGQLLL